MRQTERLTRLAGVRGVKKSKRVFTTRSDKITVLPADLVNRWFSASAPRRLWVCDITYVATWSGFVYVACVTDVYSRRIVGWNVASTLRSDIPPIQALDMAVWNPPRERAGIVDMLASPWLDARGQASFYRQIVGVASSDTRAIADALHATRCAVRIGWGRDDPWLPLGQAYELQAAFPGHAEVIVFDEVGHLAPVVGPAAVVTAVRGWLRR